MSSNEADSSTAYRRRSQGSRWIARVVIFLIALVVSVVVVLFLFSSGSAH
jgi:flagellar basal body-associated protein FliL